MFGLGSKDEDNRRAVDIREIDDLNAQFAKNAAITKAITETADSILDNAVDRLVTDRNHHAERMEYWRGVMEDAAKRLSFHTTIHDALNVAIAPMVSALDITFEPEEMEITFDDAIQSEIDGNSPSAGGKSDAAIIEPVSSGSAGKTHRSTRRFR
jgi:hypothetical protein